MPRKHLDGPELDSLFLLHNLCIYEPVSRLRVSPEDTQRDGGGGRREGCLMGGRAAVDKETVRGMVAEGGA